MKGEIVGHCFAELLPGVLNDKNTKQEDGLPTKKDKCDENVQACGILKIHIINKQPSDFVRLTVFMVY